MLRNAPPCTSASTAWAYPLRSQRHTSLFLNRRCQTFSLRECASTNLCFSCMSMPCLVITKTYLFIFKSQTSDSLLERVGLCGPLPLLHEHALHVGQLLLKQLVLHGQLTPLFLPALPQLVHLAPHLLLAEPDQWTLRWETGWYTLQNQHTSELISAQKIPHTHNSKDLSRLQ